MVNYELDLGIPFCQEIISNNFSGGRPPIRAKDKLKALTNPNKRTPVSQPHSSLPAVYMPYKDPNNSAYLPSSSKSKRLGRIFLDEERKIVGDNGKGWVLSVSKDSWKSG